MKLSRDKFNFLIICGVVLATVLLINAVGLRDGRHKAAAGEKPSKPAYEQGQVIIKLKREEAIALPAGDEFQASALKSSPFRQASEIVGVTKIEKAFKEDGDQAVITRDEVKEIAYEQGMDRMYVVDFPQDKSVEEVITQYEATGAVEYASPNYIYHGSATPDDTYFTDQWSLRNTGQTVNGITGTPDADIDATGAWDIQTGSTETLIAVIDTGVNYNHEDLAGRMYSTGYDYVNGDSDAYDDHGHGSYIAGIIAAVSNNATGIAGIDWNAKILPVKVLDENMSGNTITVALGIVYAMNQGADILNLSLASDPGGCDESLDSPLTTVWNAGILIVAAANNQNTDIDSNPLSPACNDGGSNHVIAVANTNQFDQKYTTSNYGATMVDISAPGTNLTSLKCCQNDGYSSGGGGGTSFSTPHVVGAAALLWAEYPDWTNAQVRDRLLETGDNIDNLNPSYAGKLGLRLNIYNALNVIPHPIGALLYQEGDGTVYYLDTGNVLRAFSSAPAFYSQGHRFQDVLKINTGEFSLYSSGDLMPFADGALIKSTDSNTIYFVSEGLKRPIAAWHILTGLGFQGSDITVVSPQQVAVNPTGEIIYNITPHPAGTLVKGPANGTIYYINAAGEKQTFNSYKVYRERFRGRRAITISQAELGGYPTGAMMTFPDGTLLKQIGYNTIYAISESKRRGFTNYPLYRLLDYVGKEVLQVYAHELALHQEGTVITD